MIRDLEVLLLSIPAPESREYMGEAVACYNAGAYRAGVVLSVAAGMDGLRRKLATIVSDRGAPKAAVEGHKVIEKRFNAQDAFEYDLIGVCEDATLLTPAEAKKLHLVLKTRHLCAHPSGHTGTAEEARDAITTVIDLVLSRPAMLGLAGVSTLIERLESPNFFPNPADQDNVNATVRAEVRNLHPALHNALVPRLLGALIEAAESYSALRRVEGGQVQRGEGHKNLRRFLAGLFAAGNAPREVVWKYIGRLVEAPAALKDTLWLLGRDPTGLPLADPLVRDRAVSLVRRNLDQAFARRAAKRWIRERVLSDDELEEILESATRELLAERVPDIATVDEILGFGWCALDDKLFQRLIEGAGKFDWGTANASIQIVQDLSQMVADRIPDSMRVEYILNVARRAEGEYAAFAARDVRDQGLGPRADFIDALIEATKRPDQLLAVGTVWEEVARILMASGRNDALLPLISMFEEPSEDAEWGLEMLKMLLNHEDKTVAARAAEVREMLLARAQEAPLE